LTAADAAEPVAARAPALALEPDFDVVPVVERVMYAFRRVGIGAAQRAERLIGEDHAPAKRIALAITLVHDDFVPRVGPLHEQREVEAGRSSADAGDAHTEGRSGDG
jgi:hypothetical protein